MVIYRTRPCSCVSAAFPSCSHYQRMSSWKCLIWWRRYRLNIKIIKQDILFSDYHTDYVYRPRLRAFPLNSQRSACICLCDSLNQMLRMNVSKNQSFIACSRRRYVSSTTCTLRGSLLIVLSISLPSYLILLFLHRHITLKVTTSFDKGPQETLFTSLAEAR